MRQRSRVELDRRQSAASATAEARLADAHHRSAEACRHRQSVRGEDALRAELLRELGRPADGGARERGTAASEARAEVRRRAPPAAPEGLAAREPAPAAPVAATPASPAARAEEIAAMVERIEAAVTSGRPALVLGLTGAAGTVEIVRSSKGEVRVKIRSHGALRQRLLDGSRELEAALAARGLRVRALEIC